MTKISLTDIRKEFLSFFSKKNHDVLPSSPLVPTNDIALPRELEEQERDFERDSLEKEREFAKKEREWADEDEKRELDKEQNKLLVLF